MENKNTKGDSSEDHDFTFFIGIICLLLLLCGVIMGKAKRPTTLIGPEYTVKAQEAPTPTPTLTEKEQIESYIQEKFGEHSEKAFILLKGKGPGSCAENRHLDTKAVNDNTEWGGVGRDCGIFQVNDYYHPFTCEQMKNWKDNIDYAHRMFENDNNSFIRWTCGKHYGI